MLVTRNDLPRITSTEREGFEPSNEVDPRYAISSRARSTAPAPLRRAAPRRRRAPCDRVGPPGQGYDTGGRSVARLPLVVLAISEAASKTIGLAVTFGGIGVLVNIILILIAVQIRGERRQNQEYRERLNDR